MSEEKKEQQDFLSGHEALLNSINSKKETPQEETEPETENSENPASEAAAQKPADEPTRTEPDSEETENSTAAAEEEKSEPEAEVVEQKVVPEVPPVVTEVPAKPAPKKKKPANHEQAVKQRHEAVEKAEVKEVLKFYQKYLKPAAAAIIVICVVVIAVSLVRNNRIKKVAAADSALMSARTAADYQAILEQYGNTPSAPMALMGLAQSKFNDAQPAAAAELYADFVKKYPKHEMTVQAEYNAISCLEAERKYDEAAAAFAAFQKTHEKSHLAPVALLDQGRCLEAMEKYTEARQVYEDVLAFYPDSGWAQLAQDNISIIDSKLK
ncbi:tetratricopeptide repeat protein [Verrucomicrobia bacterium S94]|nr:tetratricopeptide repeat protein [Verrucomicrobia bacterium S94]